MPTPSREADLSPPLPDTFDCDVLVIGGGPSGAAAGYWLAKSGVDVLVVEKKHFPREKTCGDGLTPRSVRQLFDMGLEGEFSTSHRIDGLCAHAFGKELTMAWPPHDDYPRHGYVVTREELDERVTTQAANAGAVLWQGAEAVSPLGDSASAGGPAKGAVVSDLDHGGTCQVSAQYVVIADGANSRFGRGLGTTRNRDVPLGMALRGYYSSPRHGENYIESHLDLRDRDGRVLPGYGWIFPVGDGRVNVGVGLLSSAERLKQVNTTKLMDAFVANAPDSWCLGDDTSCGPATGGRLPMGLSVLPHSGPDYLMIGDASGAINPFNGEGIAYGYETGRMAAAVLSHALTSADPSALAIFDQDLESTYGLYYRVASAFMRTMGRPELLRRLVHTGMYSKSLMEWVLRIMSNMLRADEVAPAELVYKGLVAIVNRHD